MFGTASRYCHELYILLENGNCHHEIARFRHNEGSATLGTGYYYFLDAKPGRAQAGKTAPTAV